MSAKTVRGFGEIGYIVEDITETDFKIIAGAHCTASRCITTGTIYVRFYVRK